MYVREIIGPDLPTSTLYASRLSVAFHGSWLDGTLRETMYHVISILGVADFSGEVKWKCVKRQRKLHTLRHRATVHLQSD